MSDYSIEDFVELSREMKRHEIDRQQVGCPRDTREHGARCFCYLCESEIEDIDEQIEALQKEVKRRTDMLDMECVYCRVDATVEEGNVGELLYEAGLFELWDKMQDEKVSRNLHNEVVKAALAIYKRTH